MYGGKFVNVLVGGSQGAKSDLLGKGSKIGISKEGHVPKEFMTNIRFWSVEGPGVMPQVLSRVEDSEGKSIQKVPCRQ